MYWTEFATIAVAHLFAVASPGPDFAVVMRQCVNLGTRAGLWTSAGVGTGILVHVAYCLLGVALVLSQSPTLFTVFKLTAAAYLLYLGITAIHASLKTAPPHASPHQANVQSDNARRTPNTSPQPTITEVPNPPNTANMATDASNPTLSPTREGLASESSSSQSAQIPAFSPTRAFTLGFLTNGLNPKATLFFLALFAVVIAPTTPVAVQLVYGLYLAVATFLWFALLSSLFGYPTVRSVLLKSGVWFERGMGLILIALAAQIALTSL